MTSKARPRQIDEAEEGSSILALSPQGHPCETQGTQEMLGCALSFLLCPQLSLQHPARAQPTAGAH